MGGVVGGLAGFVGGGGGVLALAHLLEVRLRSFGRAEDEVALHLIELGVVRVFHPNNPALAGVDTGDGAHLYPAPIWDVGGSPHKGGAPPWVGVVRGHILEVCHIFFKIVGTMVIHSAPHSC